MNRYITVTLMALITSATGQAQVKQLMQELVVSGIVDQLRCTEIEEIVFNSSVLKQAEKDTHRLFAKQQEKTAVYTDFGCCLSANPQAVSSYFFKFTNHSIHIRAPNA